MNKINFTKLYGCVGRVLCGVAGAIVGFITGGIWLAILGLFVGLLAGHLFKKFVVSHSFEQ